MTNNIVTGSVQPFPGLTEGRIVHYVLPDGRSAGQVRPAIVVRVWRDVSPDLIAQGYSNLQVFTDGDNDYPGAGMTIWATSKVYSENHEPGTWHWPPKV
ncbi:MAG: hypothetical protein HWQ36_26220 [Nostoc sp. NMS2]|uniref:hypothetical protein n=1 Tax=Nostoc sp. NMS2 TaxID=2815389 RepID=UPI0025DF8EEB|nr:hypothetical protein [Nostoc sp. NMS2]MBN3993884.1 hypothetical protein [Nostoc sp. NMS2]